MNETNNNSNDQRPRTSKLAAAALGIAICGLFCAFFAPMQLDLVLASIGIVAASVGTLLGMVSVFLIVKHKGKLAGYKSAISGAVLNAILVIVFSIGFESAVKFRKAAFQLVCGSNLHTLGKALQLYSGQNEGNYPAADRWCDLLIENLRVSTKEFKCPTHRKQPCSYALNPNCGPNSPPGTVLLFETKGSWNQSGGLDMLTTENHGGRGCNIMFCDFHVEFVPANKLAHLKWKAEEAEK